MKILRFVVFTRGRAEMKAVVQRVKATTLSVDGRLISAIDGGLTVFLGVGQGDEEKDSEYLAKKIASLRIFEDDEGKMNLSVLDVKKEVLLVSQFTLYGDTSHGNRPSFTAAEKPDRANELYLHTAKCLEGYGVPVKLGVFGADMQISQHNDGPVTILLDSGDKKNK